uniref:Ribonuclease H protein At1g65750 family n=1 Tax=Cajanus cajan TaxID=3821 RepID=A0A151SDY8_CAJCA|nr:Putative ribonuclease H protein At1g65750 family [Cajanus cajan]
MRINFHKSSVVGIHSGEDFTELAASFLHCKLGQLPFKHLGLPLGANPRKLATWRPILDGLRKRLSSWKHRYLSIGGRVTLINAVLNAMPIHFLSFFKAPNSVIKEIVAIQRDFLWRGVKDGSKIPWVKWETVCGLRLLDVFPRLYSFAFDPLSMVGHNGNWEGSTWLWQVKWRRETFVHEEGSVNTLIEMLQEIQIFSSKQDQWRWICDKDGVFSVKSAYSWLQHSMGGELSYSSDFILVTKSLWKCKAPIKCLVFCWQVFMIAFPCKSLLQVRGVEVENNLCSLCSLFIEDPIHLFLLCPMAFNIWLSVANWLEVEVVLPNSLTSLYLYWTNLGIYKKSKQCFKVVWVSVIWSLWLHRNGIIFQQGVMDCKEVLDNIKMRSWKWIKSSVPGCSFSYSNWYFSPRLCIS